MIFKCAMLRLFEFSLERNKTMLIASLFVALKEMFSITECFLYILLYVISSVAETENAVW